jgi:hypothetical protein
MDKRDVRETTQSGNGELSEDDVHWLTVEIIQDRYKDVPKKMIAKIAEKVTEEEIPLDLSKQSISRMLSKRITTEVKSMGKKAPKPVGHDRLVTIGRPCQDSGSFADSFSNTTECDPNSNYGDLIDNRLSKLNLEQNEGRLEEQEQAKTQLDCIKRGISPKSRAILNAIESKGGPDRGDTNNSIAKAIGVDHKDVDRCIAEAREAAGSGWRLFPEPEERPALAGPQKVPRNGYTGSNRSVPLETIRETSGMPTIPLIEKDRRTRVSTNPVRYIGGAAVPRPHRPRSKRSELEKLEARARRVFARWKKCVHNSLEASDCEKCIADKAEFIGLEKAIRERRAPKKPPEE